MLSMSINRLVNLTTILLLISYLSIVWNSFDYYTGLSVSNCFFFSSKRLWLLLWLDRLQNDCSASAVECICGPDTCFETLQVWQIARLRYIFFLLFCEAIKINFNVCTLESSWVSISLHNICIKFYVFSHLWSR
jgi:hypothetical protein